MEARGLTDADLLEGAHRASMAELAASKMWAEKVVTF
jgi:sulfur relay (sulfurtransferase) complex TusBCD TusD component (DsrE family)